MTAETTTIEPKSGAAIRPWVLDAACVLLFAVTSAFVFRGAWNPTNTFESGDAAIFLPLFVQKWTDGLFIPRWFPHFLAGIPQQFQFLSHALPLMVIVPPHRFHGFEYMLDTFLAGAFMFAFLRDQRIGRFGSLVGGLAFQLGNGLLTGARQGLLWKFDTACWVPLFLLFFSRIIYDRPNCFRNSFFAGAALGLQFLGGEIQIAYYMCLFALAYFAVGSFVPLYPLNGTEFRGSLEAVARRLWWAALSVVVGIILSAEVICSYMHYMRQNENVGVTTEMDNWQFATEFSFGPREVASLVLTGAAFGDMAHSHDSAEGMTHRITDDYMGIVVALFAFIALFSRDRRAYFFACTAFIVLLISFGKHFPPPYRLIYELPFMKGFRNPHKWLFIAAVCVPVLAGMGADYWKNAPQSQSRKILCAVLLFVAIVIGIVYSLPMLTGSVTYAGGLPPAVNRPLAMLVLASLVCVLWRMQRAQKANWTRSVFPLILIALLAGDLILNASRYISYYDFRTKYVHDDLVAWFKTAEKPFRVKLWAEDAYLRTIVTKALPYYGIDVMDAIMSRRPGRYSDVFQATREGRLPFRKLFQLFNVRYILSSVPVGDSDISLTPVVIPQSGHDETPRNWHAYEMSDYLPRVYIVDNFKVSDSREIIGAIAEPDFDFQRLVILEKQPALVPDASGEGPTWNIDGYYESPHRVSMHVTVDKPSLLVLHDFADEYWHAHVDEEEVEILRANYLMRAIAVPEGEHSVTFKYRPPIWGYVLTLAGWCGIALFIISVGARKVVSHANQGNTNAR